MLQRIEGKVGGESLVFGVSPRYQDLDWTGLAFSMEQFQTISAIDPAAWHEEFKLHDELFARLAHGLPSVLPQIKDRLSASLAQRQAA